MQVINAYLIGADTVLANYYEFHPVWSSYDAENSFDYTRVGNATDYSGGLARQGTDVTADDGDSISYFVFLPAGTYRLTVIYAGGTNRASVDCYLDATNLGTIDMYDAANSRNLVGQISSIVVANGGNYTFKLQANGKNASSYEYYIVPNSFSFIRTGA